MKFKLLFLLYLLFAVQTSFAGVLSIDAKISADTSRAGTSVTTPAFTTSSTNELLLAFVATDYNSGTNTTVTGITGGGLTWVLVKRTNAQYGTAEIWRAFATQVLGSATVRANLSQSVVASISVVSFIGANSTGTNGSGAIGATGTGNANPGAPTATLTTTVNGSWVFGVGNDWDNAIGRTVGSNQSLLHQSLSSTGDTYWMQMQNSPTPYSGTSVSINDTGPAGDQYNLSIVEVLPSGGNGPPAYSISGTVSPANLGSLAMVGITPSEDGGSVRTDSNGNYVFTGIPNGNYTLTPTGAGLTFTPATQTVTVNGANLTGVNFTASQQGGTLGPKWTVLNRHGDYGNDELQCYTPANVFKSGGYLNIVSQVQQATCGDSLHQASNWNYTSGMVQWTNFSLLYGKIEVRAKMPGGVGSWPAIWLLGYQCEGTNPQTADNTGACNWPYPGSDEIDYLEFYNYAGYSFTSLDHNIFRSTGNINCDQNMPNGADASKAFHLYTITWGPGSLGFAVDGVPANCSFGRSVPNTPMFLIINNAMGGGGGCPSGGNCPTNSQFPQTMQVDYVHVWDQSGNLTFDEEFN